MAKHALRDWLEKIFPSDDGRRKTNELVERGLEALRMARNERAFAMGDTMRVPSRLELRLPEERFDELKGMDALRDLEFFFNDELMRDLSAENMRTFGDHATHVTIAVDTSLRPDEVYALVMSPETKGVSGTSHTAMRQPSQDATIAIGGNHGESTRVMDTETRTMSKRFRLVITGPNGYSHEEILDGDRWIIGRRGSSGTPLSAGYRKLDIDLRETISREQVRVDILDDRMRIQRIGKANVGLSKRDILAEGEERMIALGVAFWIEEYQVVIST